MAIWSSTHSNSSGLMQVVTLYEKMLSSSSSFSESDSVTVTFQAHGGGSGSDSSASATCARWRKPPLLGCDCQPLRPRDLNALALRC